MRTVLIGGPFDGKEMNVPDGRDIRVPIPRVGTADFYSMEDAAIPHSIDLDAAVYRRCRCGAFTFHYVETVKV